MTKKIEKNSAKAIELTANEIKAEQLAIALAKAGMADQIEAALVQLGVNVPQAEHDAARPKTSQEIAYALAADLGLDLRNLKPAKASTSALAVNVPDIAKALGKYGKHCFAADTANGTSIVTHSITAQLVNTGKATLAKTLDDARKHLPSYSSTGHFNTCKRLLKEHYSLNVWQGGFSINTK